MEASIKTNAQDDKVITRLEKIFALQKKAFEQDAYPSETVRIERMKRVTGMLKKYREEILEALDKDFG